MDFETYKHLHERIFRENGLECYLDDVSRETLGADNGAKADSIQESCDGSLVSRETNGGKTELFYCLTTRMLEVNEHMNLTAVRDPEAVIYLHYADSLMIADEIPAGTRLCDVGCGAGFPSLPLAITRNDVSILAVDSTEKKVRYVAETAEILGLSDRLEARSARAEELGQGDLRGAFPCVTARAVSNLRMLAELCLPLVAIGGTFLSMKGANWQNEYMDAASAIEALGGRLVKTREFDLKNGETSEKRCLLTIRKVSDTPAKYPRAWGKIKSKPL